MKFLLPIVLLGGCSTVTLNGADVTRLTALSAIGVIGVALIVHDEDKPASDKHFRCPTCPPATLERPQ